MLIEKLYKKFPNGVPTARDGYDAPGLVNTFLRTEKTQYQYFIVEDVPVYFRDIVTTLLSKHNIYLGRQFGSTGLSITELMNNAAFDPDTVFELHGNAYRALTPLERRRIKNLNVVVYEYFESDTSFDGVDLSHHITASNNLSGTDLCMPIFAVGSYATCRANNYMLFDVPKIDYVNPKILLPIHKPRPERVNLLETLDRNGLLEQADWSLTLSTDTAGQPNDFWLSPNVGTERWQYMLEHPFYLRHAHELPKKLDHINFFSECIPLHIDYHGKYAWHIACETYIETAHFPTEKTYKAMIGGHPLLTIAKPGFNQLLEEKGFKLIGDYDHLAQTDRIEAVVDIIKHDKNNYSAEAEHNYNRMMDREFLANLLLSELIKLEELL